MFSSVQSIFQYSAQHRQLLLRAKEAQDPVAIFGFDEVYSKIFKSVVKQILQRENVSIVVLPRLSLRRVMTLHWHSVDFFRRQLEEVCFSLGLKNDCLIFMRSPFPTRKRAQMTSLERIESVEQSTRFRESWSEAIPTFNQTTCEFKKSDAGQSISVLFIDDVLTSGGTLLKEFDFIREHDLRNDAGRGPRVGVGGGRLQVNWNAHILTLFRTPVADCKRGESK